MNKTRPDRPSDPAAGEATPEAAAMAPEPDTEAEAAPASGEASEGAAPGAVPMEPTDQAVHRLEAELAELQDRHARLAAEFDNYRKRVSRENQVLNDRAQAALAIRVLEVLDDLDRILEGATAATPSPTLHEALAMVDRKLRKELEAAGLERVDPTGAPFDPSVHEAVATTPAASPEQDGLVSATFQAGYRFRDALIRPARVQVYSDQGQD